jgi:hypothetical protein
LQKIKAVAGCFLAEEGQEVADAIFESISESCFELMKDGFGNYLI